MHNDLIRINLEFVVEQAKYFQRKQEFHPYVRLYIEISKDEHGSYGAWLVDACGDNAIHKIGVYRDYFTALNVVKEWWYNAEIDTLMDLLLSKRNFIERLMVKYSIADHEKPVCEVYTPTKKEVEVLSLVVYEQDLALALELGQLPYSNSDILRRAEHYGVSIDRSNLHRALKKLVSKNILIEEENTTLVWMDSGKGEGKHVKKKVKQYRQVVSSKYDNDMIEGWHLYLDNISK
ncbi:hypothetical protein Q9X91_004643 [Vibrio alginolyticus]|nr:hypothetical protein [Vibrio alginolyticus]